MGSRRWMKYLRVTLRIMACGVVAFMGASAIVATNTTLRHPNALRRGWNLIETAMWSYDYGHHGVYPYDQRGQDDALRVLLDYMPSQGVSLADPRQRGRVPAPGTIDRIGLDYLNSRPHVLEGMSEDVILLSYTREAWPRGLFLPFYSTCKNGRVPFGAYRPWVRPERIVGLPTAGVERISEYALEWGVCCD